MDLGRLIVDLILDGLQTPHGLLGALAFLIQRRAQEIEPGLRSVGYIREGFALLGNSQSELSLHVLSRRLRMASHSFHKLLFRGFGRTSDLLMPAIDCPGEVRLDSRLPIGLCGAESRGGLIPQFARRAFNLGEAAVCLFDLSANALF